MGSVSASARLPLAVSAAGAHGMYPGLSLPPAALAPVLEALVLATAAFGVNFIVPFMDLDSLELAVDQAPYVDFFLADPDDQLVQRVHAGGAHCGWQVESVDEARAAEAAGCDVVIAKAWESGGRKRIEGPTLLARAEEVHSRPRGTQRAPSKPCRSTRASRSARFAWCSPPRRSLPSSPPGCRADLGRVARPCPVLFPALLEREGRGGFSRDLAAAPPPRRKRSGSGGRCRVCLEGSSSPGVVRLRSARKVDSEEAMGMGDVAGRRLTAEIEGDFVVFLIGARFNNKLQFARSLLDLGGRRGMKHMLDYLVARPDKGLLAYEIGLPTVVQYWRSFEHLEAFAKDKDDPHLDVWRQYWRRVGRSGRTGIWHETFLVKEGHYEAVYGNMPPHGLGKAGRLVPLSESSSARARLKALSV